MGAGSRRYIAYVEEVDWGTTPLAPEMKLLRNTGGGGIQMQRDTNQSQEFRSDRQIASVRLGNKRPTLDVPFEFSFSSFDDFLEAALFGEFAAAVTLSGLTVSVDSTEKTFTAAAATFIKSGLKIGDSITTSGFTDAGNNGTFVITGLSETVITCSDATGLKTVSGDTEVGIVTARLRLKQGVTQKSFTIEEGFNDIEQYQVMTGAMVNTFSLSATNNAMITGSFSLIAKEADPYTETPLDASPTAAPITDPFDSYTGSLTENEDTVVVTSLSLSLSNGLESLFALFSDYAQKVGVGRANLTGSLSAYFEDATLANKFLNETESALEFSFIDLDGNKYTFILPRIKYTGATKNITENNVVVDYPFQALADSDTGTCFIIDKETA